MSTNTQSPASSKASELKLAPCPFCGCREVGLCERNGLDFVMCDQCTAEGPAINNRWRAIDAWNRRAPLAAEAPDAEAVPVADVWPAVRKLISESMFDFARLEGQPESEIQAWVDERAPAGRAAPVASASQKFDLTDYSKPVVYSNSTHIAPVASAEPILYQRRMRPTWNPEGQGWTAWEECSKGAYDDCLRAPVVHGWQHEVRALGIVAQAAPAPADDPYKLDDDDMARFPNDTDVVIVHKDYYWKLRGCEDICAALDAKPVAAPVASQPAQSEQQKGGA